jgi:hypothetical protein
MASSAPSTPRQRISSRDLDADVSIPGNNRSRLGSNEIPRTYSGLYGAGAGAPQMPVDFDDGTDCDKSNHHNSTSALPSATFKPYSYRAGSTLLPFELTRNRNTDWFVEAGPALLLTYISIVLTILLTFLAFVPEPKVAWTLTNIVHVLVTLIYLHWIKGNPADYMDGTQGEMNAMTLWEQIVSAPSIHLHDSPSVMLRKGQVMIDGGATGSGRDVLVVVPTLLALASCYVANFESIYAIPNVILWAVVMLPKMPFMNGVRIFGINRTIGIDDGDYLEDEDDGHCIDTEDESALDSVGCDLSEKSNDVVVNEPKKSR